MSGTGWGWAPTAAPAPIPPSEIFVRVGDGLQEAVDALPSGGGTIRIGDGIHYADPSSPATALAMNKPVRIAGQTMISSVIGSPIHMSVGQCGLEHLWVRPSGGAYGVRIYDGTNFLSRCWMERVFIGASSRGAGDGPVNGIELDGAGVFYARQLTCAFNTGHGMLVDSTGVEPNTTILCDCSTFSQNGIGGTGYGVKIMQSLTLAHFVGGNMENNISGELYGESANGIILDGVDFERGQYAPGMASPTINNMIELQNVLFWKIGCCNIIMQGGTAVRGLLTSGGTGHLLPNRWEGWATSGIARIGETSINTKVDPQRIVTTSNWIEDYSH